MIYGLYTENNEGMCLDCLDDTYGTLWEVEYDNKDSYYNPKDLNGEMFKDFIHEDHPTMITCIKCNRIWDNKTQEWNVKS